MNQILQDPYLYELVKDIQKQCSFSSLEALARETGFIKRKRQMTPEAFMAFCECFMNSVIGIRTLNIYNLIISSYMMSIIFYYLEG